MSIHQVWVKEELGCVETDPLMVKQEPRDSGNEDESEVPSDFCMKSEITVEFELQLKPKPLQSSNMGLVCVQVKEEEDIEKEPECSAKEAGLRGVSAAAARAGLYANHVVKDELMLGPEGLQPADAAFTLPVKSEPFDHTVECDGASEPVDNIQRSVDDPPASSRIYKREKPRKIKRNFTVPRFTTYECDDCGKRFPYKSYLVRHIQVHLEKKFYCCNICQKQFTSKFNYKEHGRLHTGQKLFVCEFCNKGFSLKSYLTRHQLIHKDDRMFACDVCDKKFTVRSYLVTHRRIHTGEKPHSCEICHKQFKVRSYLITHMLTHTQSGGKAHSCDVCNKQFEYKTSLNLHKRTHSGEKPYSCNVCKKRFFRKSAMAEHLMIHDSKKAYTCSVCDKQFTHKCNLNSHFRIHTGEKRFSCEVCKKRFTFKSNLQSHYRYYPGDHRNPDDEPPEVHSDISVKVSLESRFDESLEYHTSIKRSPQSLDLISVNDEPEHPSEGISYLDGQLPIKQCPLEECIPLDLSSVDRHLKPTSTHIEPKDVQSSSEP